LLIVITGRVSANNILFLGLLVFVIVASVSALGQRNDFDFLYDNNRLLYNWPFYFFRVMSDNAKYIVYMLIGSMAYLWRVDRLKLSACVVYTSVLFAFYFALFVVSPNGLDQLYYVEDGLRVILLFFGAIYLEKHSVFEKYKEFILLRLVSRLLNFLGDISYPLYLIHGLVGMTLISLLSYKMRSINLSIIIGGALIFCVSWVIHVWIERKFILLASKVKFNALKN
jgi:peptidoglycan/LPS O-acetylase OafA/YrhL